MDVAVTRAVLWLCVVWMSAGCGKRDARPSGDVEVAIGAQQTRARPSPARARQMHSGSLVANPAGSLLFVAHPDADSVSVIDVSTRTLAHEVLLAAASPTESPLGRYEPAVQPRALAVDAAGATLFVTGQRSGSVYAVDVASGTVKASAHVCSEPIGVLVSRDDAHVFVACSQDDEVVELRASDLSRLRIAPCPREPWALAWAADGKTLLATHLLGPGVTAFATAPLARRKTWPLADGVAQGLPCRACAAHLSREPHGPVRGIYDALVRPGTSELWVAHIMLGIDTPQPSLDFRQTVFPALSILDTRGRPLARLSVQGNPGDAGAFGDVVSGPHALAFSPDGHFALVADASSEDVLVVDAERRVEAALVRPLRGHLPEGIAWVDGKIYVQDRNTETIEAFRLTAGPDGKVSVEADGAPFRSLSSDPMPVSLRLGQKLYFSANSDDVPTTQNHWVSCASCHIEGRSDAVTWLFTQGPRDTPTNAGGLLDTGFLFRTADRTRVEDYFLTINLEQGGHFQMSEPSQRPLLKALAAFVNEAIPAPVPPSTDASHALRGKALDDLRARGEAVFSRVGCATCHAGPAKTDSGSGNPELNLKGPVVASDTPGGVLLHDVGTCVKSGPAPDVDHLDVDGDPRAACSFDTPALRGLSDSAPYLHDGSAMTLADVLPAMLAASAKPGIPPEALSSEERRALVEYLRGL
jgi:YVTN family beta-propeller protein